MKAAKLVESLKPELHEISMLPYYYSDSSRTINNFHLISPKKTWQVNHSLTLKNNQECLIKYPVFAAHVLSQCTNPS